MKSILKKGLRITGTAAAVSAILLSGTMLSGCDDSKNWINDGVKLTVVEEGDLATGKPYKIKASRHLSELRADHGDVTTVNPVTGENAGANEWFYVFSEDNFSSYELNSAAQNDVNDSADNDGAGSSLKDFTETFHATLEDGRTRKVQQTFAAYRVLSLLARPGVRSLSWQRMGMRFAAAPRTTGTDTKPPLLNTTSGCSSRINFVAWRMPLMTLKKSVTFLKSR